MRIAPLPRQVVVAAMARAAVAAARAATRTRAIGYTVVVSRDLHFSSVRGKESYWGPPAKDGQSSTWTSYQPGKGHNSMDAHHTAQSLVDKLAFVTVKLLRVPTDLFFRNRFGCRAVMLETVAGVPGLVAGMFLHLRSLRKMEHSGGWIKALLDEAENERMHLMTFMEVYQPKWYERGIVVGVQLLFFTGYSAVYALYPRLAHRAVGYLEEEAVHSYTLFLEEIDHGRTPNIPAPAIAIDYWKLPKDAKLRDVILVVRADEAHHRDVNHFAADVYEQGKELKEAPVE